MKIEVDGQQVEAYDLLMRKEYAKEIISGKKKVEFRSFSDVLPESLIGTMFSAVALSLSASLNTT